MLRQSHSIRPCAVAFNDDSAGGNIREPCAPRFAVERNQWRAQRGPAIVMRQLRLQRLERGEQGITLQRRDEAFDSFEIVMIVRRERVIVQPSQQSREEIGDASDRAGATGRDRGRQMRLEADENRQVTEAR